MTLHTHFRWTEHQLDEAQLRLMQVGPVVSGSSITAVAEGMHVRWRASSLRTALVRTGRLVVHGDPYGPTRYRVSCYTVPCD